MASRHITGCRWADAIAGVLGCGSYLARGGVSRLRVSVRLGTEVRVHFSKPLAGTQTEPPKHDVFVSSGRGSHYEPTGVALRKAGCPEQACLHGRFRKLT